MMVLLVVVGNSLETFERLIEGYLNGGVVFSFFHLVILVFILHLVFWEIRNCTNALNNWAEGTESREDSKNEVIQILNQFIGETKNLSAKGFYVPISDYSERLDSAVDGLIAKLYDRTNLFLIIGIAGTLFGLFDFAYKANDVLKFNNNKSAPTAATTVSPTPKPTSFQAEEGNQKPTPEVTPSKVEEENKKPVPGEKLIKLGEILVGSMSTAFPVGFFGLIFTLFSQFVAPWPEKKLRFALSKAVSKALKERDKASKSQAEIVQEASNIIKESMIIIKDSILPLKDLEKTLTNTINPVVKEFGRQLETTLNLVKEQFKQLETATNSVHATVGAVQEGIKTLQTTADSLKTLLQDAPKILKENADLQNQQRQSLIAFEEKWKKCLEEVQLTTKEHLQSTQNISKLSIENIQTISEQCTKNIQEIFEKFLENIQKTLTDLQDTSKVLSNLPNDIKEETEKVFGILREKSYNSWVKACNDFTKDISQNYINYINTITTQTVTIATDINKASEEMVKLSTQMRLLLENSFRDVLKEIKQDVSDFLKNTNNEIVNRYPQLVEQMKDLQSSIEKTANSIKEGQADLKTNLDSSQKSLQHTAETIDKVQNSLQAWLKQLVVVELAYKKFIVDVGKQTLETSKPSPEQNSFQAIVDVLNEIKNTLEAWPEKFQSIHNGGKPSETPSRVAPSPQRPDRASI